MTTKEPGLLYIPENDSRKTHLLAYLAFSVASGIPFLGKILVDKPGAVLFCVGDNPDDLHRLLFTINEYYKKLLKENESRKDGNNFALHFEDPLETAKKNLIPFSVYGLSSRFVDKNGERTPFFHEFLKALKEKEPEEGFQLIIFDPASRFGGSKMENDNAVATAFTAALESISDQLKGHPTIVVS